MDPRIVLLLISVWAVAACAAWEPAAYDLPARSCDDGGDGGVVIDGVCL